MSPCPTHHCRTAVRPGMILAGFSLALVIIGGASMEAQAQVKATDAESIASLPFEKRVCRIGFECLRPTRYDGLQNKHVPTQPMYALTPEEVADLVAETGADMWVIGSKHRGVWFASEMVKRDPHVNPEHVQRMVDRAHEHGIWGFATTHLSEMDNQDLKGQMDKWKVHAIDDGREIGLSPKYQSFASHSLEGAQKLAKGLLAKRSEWTEVFA